MEEEKKEEIKKEKPKRSTKSKVITVMLCISFFCVFSILLFVIFGRDYLPFFRNEVDNTTKEEEKKEETKISYTLNGNNLYVNNKKVDPDGTGYISVDKENVYDLGDLLLVGDCRSTCDWYFIDGNANVVGSIGKPTELSGDVTIKELVQSKFNDIHVQKVEGKTIYFYDHGYTTQDGSSICKFKDSEPVYYEEKVTYNGNNSFEIPETVLFKTKAQVGKEDLRFSLTDKECEEYYPGLNQ